MAGLTSVCWKWGDKYTAHHVNVLRAMVARNLKLDHEFVCITEDATDLDPRVRVLKMPRSLEIYRRQARRIWIFAPEVAQAIGKRVLQIDLDTVIVAPFDEVVGLPEEVEFAVWRSPSRGRHGYAFNPSFMMMTAGSRARVWHEFRKNPGPVIHAAHEAGWPTRADQSIISHALATPPGEYTWDHTHGIYSTRDELDDGRKPLPENARIVSFYGWADPAQNRLQVRCPWIKEHWRT